MLSFTVALVALHFCLQTYTNEWKELLINGLISIGISIAVSIPIIFTDKDFRHYVGKIIGKLNKKHKVEPVGDTTDENK